MYGGNFAEFQQRGGGYGAPLPSEVEVVSVPEIKIQEEAGPSEFKTTAQNTNTIFQKFKGSPPTAATIVSLDHEALSALREGNEGAHAGIDEHTCQKLVDGVMKQLIDSDEEISNCKPAVSASVSDSKAELESTQKELDTLTPGTVEHNQAKEKVKTAKETYYLAVKSESKAEFEEAQKAFKQQKPGSIEYNQAKEKVENSRKAYNQAAKDVLEFRRENFVEAAEQVKAAKAQVDNPRKPRTLDETKEGILAEAKENLAEARALCKEMRASYLAASRESITTVVSHALEKRSSSRGSMEDLYLRPDVTNLPVPVTVTKSGDIIIPLKSKWGEHIGQGGFKTVKSAITITVNKAGQEVTVSKGVSGTMKPKTVMDKVAIQNEKVMQAHILELQEDDPTEGVAKCIGVTAYPANKKNGEGQKIAVTTAYCNGGDLEHKIEHIASGDEELQTKLEELEESVESSDESEETAEAKKSQLVGDRINALEGEMHTIFEDVLVGLTWLHKHNIFQSDMKPANVLLNTESEKTRAKISDFGTSRNLNDPNQCHYFVGDNVYLSPEVKQMVLNRELKKQEDPAYPELVAKKELVETARKDLEPIATTLNEKKQKYEEAKGTQKELEAKKEYDDAKAVYSEKLPIFEKLQEEAQLVELAIDERVSKAHCPINEGILKADVYATAMTFEAMLFGLTRDESALLNPLIPLSAEQEVDAAKVKEKVAKKQEALSPEMKELLSRMKADSPEARLSAEDALQQFRGLQGNIFNKSELAQQLTHFERTEKTEETEPQQPVSYILPGTQLPTTGHYGVGASEQKNY